MESGIRVLLVMVTLFLALENFVSIKVWFKFETSNLDIRLQAFLIDQKHNQQSPFINPTQLTTAFYQGISQCTALETFESTSTTLMLSLPSSNEATKPTGQSISLE
jgi:hypothetical protein